MRLLRDDTLAFIVDMQERLVPAMSDKEDLIERNIVFAKGIKAMEIPLIISQQYTKGLGSTLPEIFEAAGTTEYFDKNAFSSWDDEKIKEAILASGKKNILVVGTEAHVCVLQSCLDMKAAGLNPVLVTDCIGSRKKNDKKFGIRRAIQEDILLTTAEAVLFELLQTSKSPYFKAISNIVK